MSWTVEVFDTGSGSWTEVSPKVRSWSFGGEMFALFEATIVMDESGLGNYSADDEFRILVDGNAEFGGYSKSGGKLRKDGLFEITVGAYGVKELRDRITVAQNSNNTNIDVVETLVTNIEYHDDSGTLQTFSLEAPSAQSISLPDYSFDGKGQQLVHEMQNDFRWVLWTDATGTAYYKPYGHDSSGQTIDSSSENFVFEGYEQDIEEGVISRVRVIGNASDGTKVSETRTASSPDLDRFIQHRIDYTLSASEAQSIGDALLQPNKTTEAEIDALPIDQLTTWRLFNQEVDLVDDTRTGGSAETLVVREWQVNSSEQLTMKLETAPRLRQKDLMYDDSRGVNQERDRLLPTSVDVDVGNQDPGNLDTGDVSITMAKTFHKAQVSGTTTRDGSRGDGNFFNLTDSFSDLSMDGTWETLRGVNAGSADYLLAGWLVNVGVMLDWTGGIGQTGSLQVRLENTTTGDFYPDSSGAEYSVNPNRSTTNDLGMLTQTFTPLLQVPRNITGDTVNVQVKFNGFMRSEANGGTAIDAQVNQIWFEELDHEHASSDLDTEDTLADADEDGTHSPGVTSGSTAQKLIDLIKQEEREQH